jgi:exodeoxyribonuclease V alpha subunit
MAQEEGFGALDLQFARWVLDRYPGGLSSESALLSLAAASLIHFARRGHLCADLSAIAGTPVPSGLSHTVYSRYPSLSEWEPFFAHSSVSDGSGVGGLFVREPGRSLLYLDRLWRMEVRVGQRLVERWSVDGSGVPVPDPKRLSAVFGQEGRTSSLDKAVRRSLESRLLVLTGGPGTGKTFTTVRILRLLSKTGIVSPERIRLSAPTGKAAQRLGESLSHFLGNDPTLDPEEKAFLAAIPAPSTVHRMIGFNPRTGYAAHDSGHPLKADLVVVDEMSMMELPLFDRLLASVPGRTRMILVGDPGQLSSVGPGSVLGDLVAAGENEHGPVVRLERSRRFAEESGIGRLARILSEADRDALESTLWTEGLPGVEWRDLGTGPLPANVLERIVDEYEPYRRAVNAESAFSALSRFRLLAVHREGERGVSGLSRRLDRLWSQRVGLSMRREGPPGRPILILENDSGLDLANGDIGIVPLPDWGDPDSVLFRSGDGSIRRIPASLLPSHAPAFCMTVHKSQGSEFETVYLVLPDEHSPVLTRELLYTAVTRARSRVVILGRRDILLSAIERRTVRFSGLSERLGLSWS